MNLPFGIVIPYFNIMLVPTIVLIFILYIVGMVLSRSSNTRWYKVAGIILGVILFLPGLLYAASFFAPVDRICFLLKLRSLPFSELFAAGMGFFPGFYNGIMRFDMRSGPGFLKISLFWTALILAVVPFIYPFIYPLDHETMGNHWEGAACTQTTEYTSGSCCVATILRDSGMEGNEREMARECFTTTLGTQRWAMGKALAKRGFQIKVENLKASVDKIPSPSILEVSFPGNAERTEVPHYIAVLFNSKNGYIVCDPLVGELRLSLEDLKNDYKLSGFCLTAENRK